MKKVIKLITIMIFSAVLLIPLNTYAVDSEWSQSLELSDSTSASVIKIEDGLIVMQYEGTASADNLLIKYDFNGKKIWEIDNNYGYYISSVSDGFIVWSEKKITKFDKDKNIIWSKNVDSGNGMSGLGNKLVELNNEYIIGSDNHFNSYDFIKIDKNGNITDRVTMVNLLENAWGHSSSSYYIYTIGKTLDGNSLILVGRDVWTGIDNINISIISPELEVEKNYSSSLLEYDGAINDMFGSGNKFNKIIETNNGYILTGLKTLTFSKDGKLNKIYSRILTDPIQIGDYIYGYLLEKGKATGLSGSGNYNVYIAKYDQNFKQVGKMKLNSALDINNSCEFSYNCGPGATGMAYIKNRVAYYQDNDILKVATINSALIFLSHNGTNVLGYVNGEETNQLVSYKYRATDETDNSPGEIINSIIKNPQTNSIIIIIVFIVLILAISITSYLIYKKRNKKEKIK